MGDSAYIRGGLNVGPGGIYSQGSLSVFDVNATSDMNAVFVVGRDGNVGVGTAFPKNKLNVRGDVNITSLATNGIVYSNSGVLTNTNPSSLEYKESIRPIGLNAGRILFLQPKSFVWKRTGYADVGYIAEGVNALLPEIYREQGGATALTNKRQVFHGLPPVFHGLFFGCPCFAGGLERIRQGWWVKVPKERVDAQEEELAGQERGIDELASVYCASHPAGGVCSG